MTSTILFDTASDAVSELRLRCTGPVLVPGDDGYERAAASWNLGIQQRPAVVVIAESAGDVAAAIDHAREECLGVAVRSTGHGTARPADGAVLIVTERLRDLHVDPVARMARIGAGLRWADVLPATQMHGLAPLLGSSPDVGAIGYTLGGGSGWLARRHGMQADLLRAVEIVTADGLVVHADATSNSELFWALRGAGAGTFGVVTAIEIDLVEVHNVYAGNLFYPAEMAAEVGSRWSAWSRTTPEELTSALVLINFPPFDDVPAALRGRSFVGVRGCHSGDPAVGRALIDEWRAWRVPAVDLFETRPFADIAAVSMDPVDPLPYRITTAAFDDVSDAVVTALAEATYPHAGPPSLVFSEIRHLAGATTAGPGALDRGRRAPYVLTALGVPHDPDGFAGLDAHLASMHAELAPHATGATYLNFTDGEERVERWSSSFDGATRQRLAALKRALDPNGLFAYGLPIG